MEITKVVLPVAGLGTRFLPLTKAVPKEMVPLVDKPAIHYVVQEALDSALHHLIFITSHDKDAIKNYFSHNPTLAATLKKRSQENKIASTETIINSGDFTYIPQHEPLGLGHAVLMAQEIVKNDPYFAIALPDDIIIGADPGLAQLMHPARQENASVIAVQEVPHHEISAYGVVALERQIAPNTFQIKGLVEKPAPQDAPSNLAIIGRYILSHKIFPALERLEQIPGKELQLTDGIRIMLNQGEKVLAHVLQGNRYDVGTPLGWLKAALATTLQHPEYGSPARSLLAQLLHDDAKKQNSI